MAVEVLLAGVAAAAAQQAEGHNGKGQQATHGFMTHISIVWVEAHADNRLCLFAIRFCCGVCGLAVPRIALERLLLLVRQGNQVMELVTLMPRKRLEAGIVLVAV